MKLSALGFTQANPTVTELSSPSSAEMLSSSSCEAEKFTEMWSLHKTSKKQQDTSDSKPESDEGQTQQASTNPESNTRSDSAPGISQMKLCSQFWCFVFNFFPILHNMFYEETKKIILELSSTTPTKHALWYLKLYLSAVTHLVSLALPDTQLHSHQQEQLFQLHENFYTQPSYLDPSSFWSSVLNCSCVFLHNP